MATVEAPHDPDHPEYLAHHFETPEQQFDAGKLGIWLFLAQEVLFFAGLFVAYTIYRVNHPEVFVEAHHHLNVTLGTLNTVVLLASSLAVAWGVRCIQLGDRKGLLWTHAFTVGCAGAFLGVKVVEYAHKWDDGMMWAGAFGINAIAWEGNAFYEMLRGTWENLFAITISCLIAGGVLGVLGWSYAGKRETRGRGWVLGSLGLTIASVAAGIVIAKGIQDAADEASGHGGAIHAAADEHAAGADTAGHEGEASGHEATAADEAQPHAGEGEAAAEGDSSAGDSATPPMIPSVQAVDQGNFFSIYFVMTGLHAVHILGGIIAIAWVIGRGARGDFSADYYGPVEYVGLYWHLVDLVWIYLFPLLYLIH